MVSTEEIASMRRQGKTDDEIVGELKRGGMNDREAYDALSRSQIKSAVSSRDEQPELPAMPEAPTSINSGMYQPQYQAASEESEGDYGPPQTGATTAEYDGNYSGMQPSMVNQGAQQESYPAQQDYGQAQGYDQNYGQVQGGDYGYPEYQPYQEAMSSDLISEISEQVVSERLAPLHDRLERVIDMKTVFESRITSLSERLARMEKIIDTLQLSLLQKVGEYVNDVHDVRKELEETQKSFGAIHKKHSHHATKKHKKH